MEKDIKKMTDAELLEALERFENRLFMLNMDDHWSESDYALANEFNTNINALKSELKERGVEYGNE